MPTKPNPALWWLSLALVLAPLSTAPRTASASVDLRTGKQAGPLPPRILFKNAPHWQAVPGTKVYWVRADERPAFDLFRFGTRFYLFDQGQWYRSNREDRDYVVIQERYVPLAISRVPSQHWRSYPKGWMNPKNPHYNGRHDNGRDKAKSKGGKH